MQTSLKQSRRSEVADEKEKRGKRETESSKLPWWSPPPPPPTPTWGRRSESLVNCEFYASPGRHIEETLIPGNLLYNFMAISIKLKSSVIGARMWAEQWAPLLVTAVFISRAWLLPVRMRRRGARETRWRRQELSSLWSPVMRLRGEIKWEPRG